jgi:hypothetical protein
MGTKIHLPETSHTNIVVARPALLLIVSVELGASPLVVAPGFAVDGEP